MNAPRLGLPGRALSVLLASSALAAGSSAQVVTRLARLSGAQEVPAVTSPGRGIGVFTIDTVANTVSWYVTFDGLVAPESAAHIHGFAPIGMTAGVLITLASGSPKCGSASIPATLVSSYVSGNSYVNIHSTAFPGGEIRGQIFEWPQHPSVCPGDGTGTACPCGNESIVGYDEGCLHSGGTGSQLRGYGQALLSANELVLHVTRSTDASHLLFQGTSLIPGGSTFGDGLRCAGGAVIRIGTKTPCGGQTFWPGLGEMPIAVAGAVTAPGERIYQVWYRNAAAFCTSATFNLSNAVRVAWMP